LFDTAACYLLIRSQFPFFKFRQALCVTFLGIFGNAAAFSAGIIPLQSYYLYKCNIEVGNTVGLMNLKYIFHKSTILIYAAIMMIIAGNQISADIPSLMKYIYTGFTLCAVIIIFLILICTLRPVQQFLLYMIEKLPNTEKWMHRKSVLSSNLKCLYNESKKVLKNKSCCIEIMLINILKLFCFYSIPFMCVKILGFSGLTFVKAQAISSVMLLIMGVMPNIAGIGPAEFTFMLLFSAFLGKVETSSALILYRTVTYFFPFLLSISVFLRIKSTDQ
ncbi:MAG: flippase-like domain-containing protein, partial [Clostridiales bacterium]|nr:flippase-like domain-containing protein [Clostridiales bacterium]